MNDGTCIFFPDIWYNRIMFSPSHQFRYYQCLILLSLMTQQHNLLGRFRVVICFSYLKSTRTLLNSRTLLFNHVLHSTKVKGKEVSHLSWKRLALFFKSLGQKKRWVIKENKRREIELYLTNISFCCLLSNG